MRGLLPFWIFLFSCFSGAQGFAQDFEELVESMTPLELYIHFDQNYNVKRRMRTDEKADANSMSEEDKVSKGFRVYQIPLAKAEPYLKVSPTVAIEDWPEIVRDDRLTVVVSDEEVWKNRFFRWLFGKDELALQGRRMLSRSTHAIEDKQAPYFAKFLRLFPFVYTKGDRAIAISAYLDSAQEFLPEEYRGCYLPEVAFLDFRKGPLRHGVVVRSMRSIFEVESDERVLPAHGFLGNENAVATMAAKRSLTPSKWKRTNYLPILARTLAHYHHEVGVSPAAHTQNMVLKINYQTGRLLQIKFRDLSDSVVDPLPRVARGERLDSISWEQARLISTNHHFYTEREAYMADIWYHAAVYVGQAIDSHVKGQGVKIRYLRVFLKRYLEEVGEIFGEPVHLRGDALRVMGSLEYAEKADDVAKGTLAERGRLRNAFAEVLKGVFDWTRDFHVQRLSESLYKPENQKDLEREFRRALNRQRVGFVGPETRERLLAGFRSSWIWQHIQPFIGSFQAHRYLLSGLEFQTNGTSIVAVDTQSKLPVAFTFGFDSPVLSGVASPTPASRPPVRIEDRDLERVIRGGRVDVEGFLGHD